MSWNRFKVHLDGNKVRGGSESSVKGSGKKIALLS